MSVLIETVLLPPGLFVFLWLVGLVMMRWYRRLAIAWCAATLLLFYLATVPVVAGALIGLLESYPPLTPVDLAQPEGQAVVVLSAGRVPDPPEYAEDTVSCEGLERLRYGAYLHHQTQLPVLVTGGSLTGRAPSFARLMTNVLERDYGVTDVWLEENSRTTWENAALSRPIMQEHDVDRIYLVTHAWHMSRAVACFENVGFEVIPAPTSYSRYLARSTGLRSWLPSAYAMRVTQRAMHEWIGAIWYRVRYFE